MKRDEIKKYLEELTNEEKEEIKNEVIENQSKRNISSLLHVLEEAKEDDDLITTQQMKELTNDFIDKISNEIYNQINNLFPLESVISSDTFHLRSRKINGKDTYSVKLPIKDLDENDISMKWIALSDTLESRDYANGMSLLHSIDGVDRGVIGEGQVISHSHSSKIDRDKWMHDVTRRGWNKTMSDSGIHWMSAFLSYGSSGEAKNLAIRKMKKYDDNNKYKTSPAYISKHSHDVNWGLREKSKNIAAGYYTKFWVRSEDE